MNIKIYCFIAILIYKIKLVNDIILYSIKLDTKIFSAKSQYKYITLKYIYIMYYYACKIF